jgi:hypothetical protein
MSFLTCFKMFNYSSSVLKMAFNLNSRHLLSPKAQFKRSCSLWLKMSLSLPATIYVGMDLGVCTIIIPFLIRIGHSHVFSTGLKRLLSSELERVHNSEVNCLAISEKVSPSYFFGLNFCSRHLVLRRPMFHFPCSLQLTFCFPHEYRVVT